MTTADWALEKFGGRPAGAAHRGPDAGPGRGPLHRRHQPARPGLCGHRAQPLRARHHPRNRYRAARAMPGVLGDLYRRGSGGRRLRRPEMPSAAQEPRRHADEEAVRARRSPTDKVRFVGDPVACVIAETVAQAKDAAEAVVVDIDPLPAVTKASEAAKPGAPLICSTTCPATSRSTTTMATARRSRRHSPSAAHVTRLDLLNNRLVVSGDGAARSGCRLRCGEANASRSMSAARARSA